MDLEAGGRTSGPVGEKGGGGSGEQEGELVFAEADEARRWAENDWPRVAERGEGEEGKV